MADAGVVEIRMPEMGESVTEGTVLEWLVAEGEQVAEGDPVVEVSTDKIDAEVPAPASGTVVKHLVAPDDTVQVGQALAEIAVGSAPAGDGAGAAEGARGPSAGASDEVAEGAVEPAAPSAPTPAETRREAEDLGGGAPPGATATGEGDADLGERTAGTEAPQPGEIETPAGTMAEAPAGEVVQLTMPEMGESVTEGTVLEWLVAEGEQVAEGDPVVEVSTDKIDAEVPAPASGTLVKHLVAPDDTVQVGQALAEIATGAPRPDAAAATGDGARASGEAAEGAVEPAAPSASQPAETGREAEDLGAGVPLAETEREAEDLGAGVPPASPVARRIAAAKGVDLRSIRGSGIGGKITKADVLAAADGATAAARAPAAPAAPPPSRAPLGAGEERPLRGPAAMLAKAMDESRAVPTATSFRTIPVDVLDAKRKALNAELAERGIKVSFTHLIAWAIVLAAREWPVMTRTYAERDGKPVAIEAEHVNLGIAVDVERRGGRSLLVPCIKAAETLDFAAFHARYEELITKTRENKLSADDFQGTNISLTNPGGLGTVASVPRLLSGQSAIIATGSIAYPPEWAHAPAEKIRALGISKVMTMTSTYDHRVIQGAESGSFLRRIEQLLRGEDNFYEHVAEALGVAPGAVTRAHPASASAPPLPAGAPATPAAERQVAAAAPPDTELLQAVQAAASLLKAFRTHGHLAARVNPLADEPKGDPSLEPENLNLTPELMERIPASIMRIGVEGETLLEALPRMREAYCGTIAYQIEHLSSHQQRMWLRDMIETGRHRRPLSPEEKRALLSRLIEVFQFERFLQKAYLGQKMFSIEGLDATVPMLDEIAALARRDGAEEVVLGMAHRGRLSVLAHNLGRSAESIMAEFEGAKALERVKAIAAIPHSGTGDVKYHYGAEATVQTQDGEIRMRLYPNPSHLEFVDPVVTGAARAAQSEHHGAKLEHDPAVAVPVLLHGDAAFPAQGVVAETLNLQALPGYRTGGTIHIIQDNQVGFTTEPEVARSTPYAGDLAKGFNVPIIHVNADDVEACIAAVRLAMAYRRQWHRDIVIDLIGYRRYGHNETDEPAYTQPRMAARIRRHPPVSQLYAERLEAEGIVSREEVEAEGKRRREQLQATLHELRAKMEAGEYEDPSSTALATGELDRTKSPDVETAVDAERLRALNRELLRVPDSFTIHRKLRKPLERRVEALESGGIEFGHAEALAFASLLVEGTHIRLTGQDTERGTFSNRHLVLHDEKTGLPYAPIQNLPDAQAPFELHNSPLSEIACLGFEYGYAAARPESLIIWEAQFGDFANVGQVIIDQFLASGESKWGLHARLTLLLPHGYEGAGPEHSSARIERFIQLASEGNMRLANPTTAAQYFHLLRRQARIAKPRPLVVFTPKGLLRHRAAASSLEELTSGSFQFVLDDPQAAERREQIDRLVLCSGKLYYDIVGHERRAAASSVAIARVELLYPFARNEIAALIASYPNLKRIIWAQEEPKNMGAWSVMYRRMPELVPEGVEFEYVGRPQRSSPSEGYPAAHRREQERIVLTALEG